MAEKKIQEISYPLPNEPAMGAKGKESAKTIDIPTPITKVPVDKTLGTKSPVDKTPVPTHSPRFTMPSLSKTSPNDLYRKLLPAVLFVLTFVTVMTVLLIYMDTVALGAAQFRVNMSRDYELARIPQASAPLVAYVRQIHLAPRASRAPVPPLLPTDRLAVMDRLYGPLYNGTFIEFLPTGPRSPSTLYLERARSWSGVAVRAATRDYLDLLTTARAVPAHACLSATAHPREVSYAETGSADSVFRSRVLCLPLYTLLLAAGAPRADYVLLGGDALPALAHLPYDRVHLRMIEVNSTDAEYRNKTAEFLATKNYTVAATFPDSVMFALNEH